MLARVSTLLVAGLVLASGAVAQDRPRAVRTFEFQRWQVAYDSYDVNGWSTCSMNLTWPTGLWVNFVSFDGSDLMINIIGRDWAVSKKESEVTFEVDSGYGRRLMFDGGGDNLFFSIRNQPEDMAELLDAVGKSRWLGMGFPNGDRHQGGIAGADKAVAEFRRCLAEWAGKKTGATPPRR
jgi:hypothetical protein